MAKRYTNLPPHLIAELKKRDRAFETDDMEWARQQMPSGKPRVIEMAFHKARYECLAVSAKKRRESQVWLIENHVKRYDGQFVIPGEPLPT